ncbi:DUF3515 domain-containing protein [Streptomyces sp. A3M-1-3]|uniref:DUF3515 domain-containing protein n=1 Tax=Streptomyces sp. A3M-1-3 TaxID=2962044 RepID=UPI0020B6505A|nr:DUF3515 domain-containing protein [Streptomyces sp. A3M-1-3]MCP3816731.1 DUF3515 domain-containing protein [Streptomyces sp. A3M-1-3]
MTPSRRRLPRRPHRCLPAVVVLLAAAGCSSTDGSAVAVVPTPDVEAAKICRALHKELPETVAGLERNDPGTDSELTAGWGDAAIVLRCGVPRPERMSDPQAKGVEVDGVNWLLEERQGDGPRFTTTYRKAYVEVSMAKKYAHDATPLTAFAGPVEKTVPASL